MSLITGIVAHVDAGKTTLSEAILFKSGAIRKYGRVDSRNTFLDTDIIERKRGITVFSKDAIVNDKITLLDTPGHVDLVSEMERTINVLDAAILLISAPDGIQAHTRTLWAMLEKANIPTLIFVNKIDVFRENIANLLDKLYKGLSPHLVDFSNQGSEEFYESVCSASDELTEKYLNQEPLEDDDIKKAISKREIFPILFGSALKLDNIEALITILEKYFSPKPTTDEFGCCVYRVSRDERGNRITHVKVTGGTLYAKDQLDNEKVNELRVKGETVKEVKCGNVAQIIGLKNSKPGLIYGEGSSSYTSSIFPALSYCVKATDNSDNSHLIKALLELEEEIPELNVNIQKDEIRVMAMGDIQIEIITDIIKRRYNISISFEDGKIAYRETIKNKVRGIGHFEPLKHYAEVHLELSPLPRGSGLVFKTAVSTDLLDLNWQRLIMTHLREKTHIGVLTGSEITDIEIKLVAGRAHLKHTEGGDFREATYRAVRNGLMKAQMVLLEPIYSFIAIIPEVAVGRFFSDIEKMHGECKIKDSKDSFITIEGSCPVITMLNYTKELRSYTKGQGALSCVVKGYEVCHNTEKVIDDISYSPLSDLENPPSSVFCSHGAGFQVPWDQVEEYCHIKY